MAREYYLGLAAKGHCMPVGTDLILQQKPDPEAVLRDGERLGAVMAEAAGCFGTPLAIPLMDLSVEKSTMLEILGVPPGDVDSYHFTSAPDGDVAQKLFEGLDTPANARLKANAGAIAYIARNHPDLIPVGMCIGPFSLVTKLIADPITAVYLAGTGLSATDDESVALLESVMEMAVSTVMASIRMQAAAGAKLIFMCEPAANTVYISPRQVAKGSKVFDRCVMTPNRRVKAVIDGLGIDLLLHDCGALIPDYIRELATLRPVILSLGSPVNLWEAAEVVPDDIVLFGNLPTKKFYSDNEITEEQVCAMTTELIERMNATGHPFIVGSECDVLSVPGHEDVIMRKVNAIVTTCGCSGHAG